MIIYGKSFIGKSHVKKNGVCQDSSLSIRLKNGLYFSAVADGVGSAPYSDEGSKKAIESLYEYCDKYSNKENMFANEEILKNGFKYAFTAITEHVARIKGKIENYDTTLSAVLYNGKDLVYGHAGDGGIIVKNYDGKYYPITERQKGEDMASVRPLRAGEISWDFGIIKDNIAAVLLVTDGMLDGVFQPVLLNLPKNVEELTDDSIKKDNVYITAIELFLNPNSIAMNTKITDADAYIDHILNGNNKKSDIAFFVECLKNAYKTMFSEKEAQRLILDIKKYNYPLKAINDVTDDKSLAFLINEKVKIKSQELGYYREPNWSFRVKYYNALIYDKPLPTEPEYEDGYQKNILNESFASSGSSNSRNTDVSKMKAELAGLRIEKNKLKGVIEIMKKTNKKLFLTVVGLGCLMFALLIINGVFLFGISWKIDNKANEIIKDQEKVNKDYTSDILDELDEHSTDIKTKCNDIINNLKINDKPDNKADSIRIDKYSTNADVGKLAYITISNSDELSKDKGYYYKYNEDMLYLNKEMFNQINKENKVKKLIGIVTYKDNRKFLTVQIVSSK